MDETKEIMPRLLRQYEELATACYRAARAVHDERGRFRRGRVTGRTHPALLKKIDLDAALEQVYRRFFGSQEADVSSFTSTSKSLLQGRETSIRPSSSGDLPVTLA